MKPNVQKMLAYANLCSTPTEKQRDIEARQSTVAFYKKLRGTSKELGRRAFLAACDHNDNVGCMFVSGKFYPGNIIGEEEFYFLVVHLYWSSIWNNQFNSYNKSWW